MTRRCHDDTAELTYG